MPALRVLLLTLVCASPLWAQQWSERLSDGVRLRVTTWDVGTFEGALRRPVDDSLRLLGGREFNVDAHPVAFAMRDVRSVDVRTGDSNRFSHGVMGFLIGGVAGGAIGAVVGHTKECAPYGQNKPGECFSYSSEVGMVTAILAVLGAGAGAVVGGAVGVATASNGWQNVYTEGASQRTR